ncbi:MAG TPA: linear amide C-N hydrolase [Solirubrobacter sp.]|nr:linear amide C-N hydrolase [Solirubrobacter sp.]
MRRLALLALLLLAGCGTTAAERPELRKVDAFPLYELTTTAPTPSLYGASGGGACTVFFADGVLGRNFDWGRHPALVLHHHPPGAFRSVSMVDMAYLDGDPTRAPRIPFDGMNERGVGVAMAAVPAARAPAGPRTTGSLGVMRLVLDRAANVAEAVAIFRRTSVDFTGGPALHYMVADATGASAVIEYVAGRVRVLPGERVMTNFALSSHARPDRRYETAAAALRRGRLTASGALGLLRRVAQPITRWSAAYDLRARTLRVVMGRRYGRVLTFSP